MARLMGLWLHRRRQHPAGRSISSCRSPWDVPWDLTAHGASHDSPHGHVPTPLDPMERSMGRSTGRFRVKPTVVNHQTARAGSRGPRNIDLYFGLFLRFLSQHSKWLKIRFVGDFSSRCGRR